jgi:hypothetical protein
MGSLRETAEADLEITLEGEFGLPVELVDPDGNEINTSVHGGTLMGQVLYEQIKINPNTGEEMVVNEPAIVLRRSSLSRIPLAGEKWFIRYPGTPSESAAKVQGVLTPTRAPDGSSSLGIIRLYPQKVKQI